MTRPTVSEVLQRATRTLGPHSESPRLDAEILLGKILARSRSALIAYGAETIADGDLQAYEALVTRRVHGSPVAYLTGTREFWSLPLAVTPDVLVPRPETELLVEIALERLPVADVAAVLDLGTGSGAIALAIASERPLARIIGIDVSGKALGVAVANGASLGLSRIEWRCGSWFDPVPGERFDLIVANPPYVPEDDPALLALAAEPPTALTPGPTGLEALEHIIDRAGRHLRPGGWLILEHGSAQAPAVAQLLARGGFVAIGLRHDYAGKARVTVACLPLAASSVAASPVAASPVAASPVAASSVAASPVAASSVVSSPLVSLSP
jgi:release factor glutamine methyltransferase